MRNNTLPCYRDITREIYSGSDCSYVLEQLPVKEFVSSTLFSPAQVLLEHQLRQKLLPHKVRRQLNRISLLYQARSSIACSFEDNYVREQFPLMYNEFCLFCFKLLLFCFNLVLSFFLVCLFVCSFVFFVSSVRLFFQQNKIHLFEFYNSFLSLKVSCSFLSLKVDSQES